MLIILGLPPATPVSIEVAENVFKGDDESRGISGMSYLFLAAFSYNYRPWFDHLLTANIVKEPLFSFVISKKGAELTIGSISSRVADPPFWASVNLDKAFWVIRDVQLNHEKTIVFANTSGGRVH